MSLYNIVIAKVENVRKLGTPYVLFDMDCHEGKAPNKLVKILKDKKIIKNDVVDFLDDPDNGSSYFVQKDYHDHKMMKTIFFTCDSSDMEADKPDYILIYSCLTDIAVNETKIGNFLKDLHRIIRDNYEPDSFNNKTSINKEFASAAWKVMDNYHLKPSADGEGGPVISFEKVRIAGKQVERLKESLIKSVEVMSMNIGMSL